MIEGYLFYTSLTGIVILVSYKARIVRKYDKNNQNHIHFDLIPRTRLWTLGVVHEGACFTRERVVYPLWGTLVSNAVMVKRGAVRFVDDVRYGRRKLGNMIEKGSVASGYMQTIIEQKKEIRKKAEKRL